MTAFAKGAPSTTIFFMCMAMLVTSCAGLSESRNPVVTKRAQMHMGTLVSITAVARTDDIAHAAINAGFQEIKRLEHLLSTWRPDSELSRVNQAAGRHPVKVSAETLELVRRSLEVARVTDGGFNIAVGPAVEAWSVTERQHVPSESELRELKLLVDWRSIQIDEAAGTLYLPRAGMRIDVGGIGKGYAADRAVEALKNAEASGGVVALSGDIKTFGSLPGTGGFPVGIRHPREEGALLATLELNDEAISTAGDYERFFEKNGTRYHHILDPTTLQPADGCQSVSVIAKEGLWADGLDTGIFVMGPKRGMELVERLKHVEAVIVDQAGNIHVSSGLRDRLRLQPPAGGKVTVQ